MTSSKIRRMPSRSVTARSRSRKPSAGGIIPPLARRGSTMTAATLGPFLLEDGLAGVAVVPRQHDDVLHDRGGKTRGPRHRLRPPAAARRLRVGRHAHHDPVVRPVKGPLELGELRAPGEGAGQAHRVHRRFRPRVGEAHALQRRDAPAQHLGQPDLVLRRSREGQPRLGHPLDGLHHRPAGRGRGSGSCSCR